MSHLIVYFSASGQTALAANKIAEIHPAPICPIIPINPYTVEDLDWTAPTSRSTLESRDPNLYVPYQKKLKTDDVDVLFLGFPVWWYAAPRIIDSFLSDLDLNGMTIIPFCISGGTGIETCEKKLKERYPQATWLPGLRISISTKSEFLQAWIQSLQKENLL